MNSQIEQIYNAEGNDAVIELMPTYANVPVVDKKLNQFNIMDVSIDTAKKFEQHNEFYGGIAPMRLWICKIDCEFVRWSGSEMVYKTSQGDEVIVAVSNEGFFIAG